MIQVDDKIHKLSQSDDTYLVDLEDVEGSKELIQRVQVLEDNSTNSQGTGQNTVIPKQAVDIVSKVVCLTTSTKNPVWEFTDLPEGYVVVPMHCFNRSPASNSLPVIINSWTFSERDKSLRVWLQNTPYKGFLLVSLVKVTM